MSDTQQKVKCPKCGMAGLPGKFCLSGCGRLPTIAPSDNAMVNNQSQAPEMNNPVAIGVQPTAALAQAAPAASMPQQNPVALTPERVGFDAPTVSSPCAPIVAAPSVPASPMAPAFAAPNMPSISKIVPFGQTDVGGVLPQVPKDFSNGKVFVHTAGDSNDDLNEAPIEVLAKIPKTVIEGFTFPFLFKIRSQQDVCFEKMQISLYDGEREISASSIDNVCRPFGVTDLSFNVKPSRVGNVSVKLVLKCRREYADDFEIYSSTPFTVAVFPSDTQFDRSSVVVNITNEYKDITVDRAGDARFGGSPLDIESAVKSASSANDFSKIIERFTENSPYVIYPFKAVALPTCLTLLAPDGFRLHLLTGKSLLFGRRKKECDVTLRSLNSDGSRDDLRSNYISRVHFRVNYDGTQCRVLDGSLPVDEYGHLIAGAHVKSSTFGTACNGTILPSSGAVSIIPGNDVEIGVAPNCGSAVLTLKASAFRCSSECRSFCGRHCSQAITSSLLLQRNDYNCEAYLAVWRCAHLGEIFPAFRGYAIRRDGDYFVIQSPNGKATILLPGITIESNGFELTAISFCQHNL